MLLMLEECDFFLEFQRWLHVCRKCASVTLSSWFGSVECSVSLCTERSALCVVRCAVCPNRTASALAHAGHASWREVDLHGWRSTLDSYPLLRSMIESLYYITNQRSVVRAFCILLHRCGHLECTFDLTCTAF